MKKLKASEIIEVDSAFIDQVAQKLENREAQKNSENPPDRIYTLEEISLMTNVKVNRATLRRYVNNYEKGLTHKTCLKAKKQGRHWLVKESDLKEFLN